MYSFGPGLRSCFIYMSLCITGRADEQYVMEEIDGSIIPKGYNKYETPLQTKGLSTSVCIILQIMAIDEIKEENMEFSMQFFVDEIWDDPRLILDKYKRSEPVLLPRETVQNLWTPDLTFVNTKGGWIYPLSVPNTAIKIHPSGSLFRYTRYNMRISCAMNLRNYPMDTQYCQMNMTPLANDERKMTLSWINDREKCSFGTYLDGVSSIFMADVKPLKYDVSKCKASKSVSRRLDGNYTTLIANFTFVRRLTSHIFNMYIPSALVVALSHLTFWLDVASVPARVALGVTSLLTLSTQASDARKHLPPVDYLTALDVWLFVCVLMVFASLVEYAAVYHTYYKRKCNAVAAVTTQMVSKAWETTEFDQDSSTSEKFSDDARFVRRNVNTIKPKQDTQDLSSVKKLAENHPSDQFIDRVSRVLFPSVFVSFGIIYWAYYLSKT